MLTAAVDLRLDPGLAERGQILAAVAVEHQLVGHELERVVGPGFPGRERVLRDLAAQFAAAEHRLRSGLTDLVTLVDGHPSNVASAPRSHVIRKG